MQSAAPGESWPLVAQAGVEACACLTLAFVVVRLVRRRRDLSFGKLTFALLIMLGLGAMAHLLVMIGERWSPPISQFAPVLQLTGALVWGVLGIVALRLLPFAHRLPSRFSLNEVRLAYAARMSSLMESAARDALTGAFNRGKLMALLENQVAEASQGSPLSALMIDIDDFKSINDTHGHLVGDEVIKGVVKAINSAVRGQDLVARFGGEEFVVLLPQTSAHQALEVAHRVLRHVAQARIRQAEGDIAVTCSIGVAAFSPPETSQDLLSRADEALYVSKSAGKHRATFIEASRREEPAQSGHFSLKKTSEVGAANR